MHFRRLVMYLASKLCTEDSLLKGTLKVKDLKADQFSVLASMLSTRVFTP